MKPEMSAIARLTVALAALLLGGSAMAGGASAPDPRSASLAPVVERTAPKVVKIYGAGGLRGLEAYQSGFLISAEGHILTAWSYVLDTKFIGVTLDDGRKFDAKLLGADPSLEMAVLKIEAADLPHFDLAQPGAAAAGSRVLAFSNLFGVATGNEPASVQHGVVAVKAPLEARRGAFETPYHGVAYLLDAMTNNPGAQGGALTDRQGRLLGMLGKELRNSLTGTWLNYAIPLEQLAPTVDAIRSGKFTAASSRETVARPEHALSLELLGLVLVPNVLDRTPPYVDHVEPTSAAARAGLRPDDLVVFVDGQLVQSCAAVESEIGRIDRVDQVKLTVMRGQQLVEVQLAAQPADAESE
jgi:S1-C subfamily serine protease